VIHMVDASNVTMSRYQALCCTQDSSLLLNPYTDNKTQLGYVPFTNSVKDVVVLRYFAIERNGGKMNLHEQVEID